MSRNNRKKNALQPQTESLGGINRSIQELALKRQFLIEKSLDSDDPLRYMEAVEFLKAMKSKNGASETKSWLLTPPDYLDGTENGYRETRKKSGINFDIMGQIGKTFVVKLIKQHRIDQITDFLNFTLDDQKEGYTIRRKPDIFEGKGKTDLTKQDKVQINYIRKFLEDGGENSKWTNHDSLFDFTRKIVDDSLTYDQTGFECLRNNQGELKNYFAVDASLLRFLDTNDPRKQSEYRNLIKTWDGEEYLPRFAMVYNRQIMVNPTTGDQILYYPWELGFGQRNVTSSVWSNNYSISEIETSVDLITWILNAFSNNGNVFKQGSNPKGILNIKSGIGDNSQLNNFRDIWREMASSNANSQKIPVFEGVDLEWINMQLNNKDMEYHEWIELLLVVFCSVYRVDPSELGFNFKNQAQMFGQSGQETRINHSRNKGLKPLLIFLAKLVNKYIVSEINDDYEFVFTGIEIEDEEAQIKLDDEKLKAGVVSFESMFEKYTGRPYDEKKDTILNQIFQQAQQSKQFGGEGMNQMVDEMDGGDPSVGVQNPFDKFSKASQSNPIASEALKLIDNILK